MFDWLSSFFFETTSCEVFDNSPEAQFKREIRRLQKRERERERRINNFINSAEFKFVAKHLTHGGKL